MWHSLPNLLSHSFCHLTTSCHFTQHLCCLHRLRLDDIYHFKWTSIEQNPEHSDFQSWIMVLSYLPKLFLSSLSHSIILPFSEKIGIIYCCHCRADCHPLSQGQSCRDIELIRGCFNFAFWGRKQIKSSGKWWQGCSIPQAKLTIMIGKVERKIKCNLPGKLGWFPQKCQGRVGQQCEVFVSGAYETLFLD